MLRLRLLDTFELRKAYPRAGADRCRPMEETDAPLGGYAGRARGDSRSAR
jgi:hypothetical protein